MSAGSVSSTASSTKSPPASIVALDFEIHGKVQGVHFRKFTQRECTRLGVGGWVMNTTRKTVVGHAEGPKAKIDSLKRWLRSTGSPKSRIDRAEFKPEKPLSSASSNEFIIKK